MNENLVTPADGGARALVYVETQRAEIHAVQLPLIAAHDFEKTAFVRTLWTGVSRGTERLVFEGRVPDSERVRMRAPYQEGDFPFPVKYGYQAVGVVEEGPDALLGRMVFALYPHQDKFILDAAALTVIPDAVPARRAVLAANMETALNAVWDSEAGPGDQILVIGGGLVGLLAAALLSRLPGASVTVADIAPGRAEIAAMMGAGFALPQDAPGEADVLIHTSATAAGLNLAIEKAGFEARIIEVSWFGEGLTAAALGGAFHARRLQLISSQVGHVAPSRRARWDYRRRIAAALSLLADPVFDALITAEVAFTDLPAALPHILAPGAPGLATAVRYD